MQVAIFESRNNCVFTEIDDARSRSCQLSNVGVRSYRRELTGGDGECLRNVELGINSEDLSVDIDGVGFGVLRERAEGKK